MTKNRKIGSAIVIFGSLVAAGGFAVGLLPIQLGVGIAVVAMLIGTGVMRGKFSSAADDQSG